MAKHARLSPSKADLWMTCPGGVPFAESIVDRLRLVDDDGGEKTSPAAAAGTMAHAYSEASIMSHAHPDESVRDARREFANDFRPRMTGDLIKNAELYVSWVTGFIGTHPNIPWGLELSAPLWYEPNSKGTADFWAVDQDTLIVVDYKSGWYPVKAENNLQIAIYLIAIYDAIKMFNPQVTKFRAGIHQPAVFPARQKEPFWWDFDMEVLERLRAAISAGAHEVDNPIGGVGRLVVSEKGCRFCPAKVLCPAQAAPMREFAEVAYEDSFEALDDEMVLSIFRDASQFRSFLDAVEDRVRDIPEEELSKQGFKVTQGSKRISWRGGEDAAVKGMEGLGIDPYKSVLKTPAAVRKEYGAGDQFDDLVDVTHNKPKIVSTKESEKRFRVGK